MPVKVLKINAFIICFVILQTWAVCVIRAEDEYDYEDAFLSDEISHEDSEAPLSDDDDFCTNQERVRIIAPRGVRINLGFNYKMSSSTVHLVLLSKIPFATSIRDKTATHSLHLIIYPDSALSFH